MSCCNFLRVPVLANQSSLHVLGNTKHVYLYSVPVLANQSSLHVLGNTKHVYLYSVPVLANQSSLHVLGNTKHVYLYSPDSQLYTGAGGPNQKGFASTLAYTCM